jgi:hypothetical protein
MTLSLVSGRKIELGPTILLLRGTNGTEAFKVICLDFNVMALPPLLQLFETAALLSTSI